jgi:hypothetical protein
VHTQAFYAKVEQLLQRPEVESVAYRADGDYAVMRLMCVEQRRRADAQGKPVGEALHLSSACNRSIDNAALGSELHMYYEGIGWGDLWIEGFGELGAPLPRLLGTDWQKFGHTILSAKDLGELRGYASERGGRLGAVRGAAGHCGAEAESRKLVAAEWSCIDCFSPSWSVGFRLLSGRVEMRGRELASRQDRPLPACPSWRC